MFEFCADPRSLDGLSWWACYLSTPKHLNIFSSALVVFAILAIVAPAAVALGLISALARRSPYKSLRWFSLGWSGTVRGVPDIIFYLFVPLALDQGLEIIRHVTLCPGWDQPIWRGNDFVVCAEAKLPRTAAAPWVHELYNIALAILAFSLVFGAFAANTIHGALKAIPKGQFDAAKALGLTPAQTMRRAIIPQMWVYALPGLANLWALLLKATPLLFLLGIEDIVYWARELGGSKTERFSYPHGDWRLWYFIGVAAFYLAVTWVSERVFARLERGLRARRGMVGA